MEAEIFKLLSVGGDVSTMLLVAIFWKLDKRITRLEWQERNLQCNQPGYKK